MWGRLQGPPQSGFARQLRLRDLRSAPVGKGSDAYQTIYRNINEKSVYIGCLSLLSKGLRGGKSRRLRVESLLRWMIASEDAKNPLKARKQPSFTRIWLAISACKMGMNSWSQGSLRRRKCNIRRNRNLESTVYIGWFVPPLERLERRDVTK